MTLRDKLIREFTRIYLSKDRKASLAETLADAALEITGKSK